MYQVYALTNYLSPVVLLDDALKELVLRQVSNFSFVIKLCLLFAYELHNVNLSLRKNTYNDQCI